MKDIRHSFYLPTGDKSVWHAVLYRETIVFEDMKFDTLEAFVSAHYESEGISFESKDDWVECETNVYGEWKSLAEMRDSRILTMERKNRLVGDLL
jgi:hypothetical protein